jgi:hypothetical protein
MRLTFCCAVLVLTALSLSSDKLHVTSGMQVKIVGMAGSYDESGYLNSLCIIDRSEDGAVLKITTIGKKLNWDPSNPNRKQLWRAPEIGRDFSWQIGDLNAELPKLMSALKKVESVWDEPNVLSQGIVPVSNFTGLKVTKTCEHYNYSSPGYDHLRVFYNETDWELLFPTPPSSSAKEFPVNISQCSGLQVIEPPWVFYNRNKNDWRRARGVISSGILLGSPKPYEPTFFNGSYFGMRNLPRLLLCNFLLTITFIT